MGAISFTRKCPSKSIISNDLATMKKESLSRLVEPVGYQIDLMIEYRVFTVNASWKFFYLIYKVMYKFVPCASYRCC